MKIIKCETDEQYLKLDKKAADFLSIPNPSCPMYALPPDEVEDRKFVVIPAVEHLFEDEDIVDE